MFKLAFSSERKSINSKSTVTITMSFLQPFTESKFSLSEKKRIWMLFAQRSEFKWTLKCKQRGRLNWKLRCVLHCSDERNKVQNAVLQWISLTPFNFYISFNICVTDGKKKWTLSELRNKFVFLWTTVSDLKHGEKLQVTSCLRDTNGQ